MKMNDIFSGRTPFSDASKSCHVVSISTSISISPSISLSLYIYIQKSKNIMSICSLLLLKSVLLQIQFLEAIPSRFGGRPSVPNAKQRQLLNQAPWFGEGLDVWENAKPKLGENIRILNPHTHNLSELHGCQYPQLLGFSRPTEMVPICQWIHQVNGEKSRNVAVKLTRNHGILHVFFFKKSTRNNY